MQKQVIGSLSLIPIKMNEKEDFLRTIIYVYFIKYTSIVIKEKEYMHSKL